MPFLELNDFKVHYEFRRETNKPVLVLSNSLGTNFEMWSPQVPAFSERFSVLRYDTRGHGASTAADSDGTMAQLGRDVVELMDTLQIERAHFCGLSMGGMIGQWLGIHAAGRIDKLVLCNTAAKIGDDAGWNQRIATVREHGMQAIVPSVIERWFTTGFRREHPDEVESTATMLQFADPNGYMAACAAIRDMDQRGSVREIKAKTLVIYGTEDKVTPPAAADFLLQQIAGAQPLPLHAAHLSNIEAASAFTAGVLAFLNDHDVQGVSYGR